MSAKGERWRCLAVGCNPVLNAETAAAHRNDTGHRVALWPVRSAEGRRRAKVRNRTGYYDKYNVGEKSYSSRVESGQLSRDDRLDAIGIDLTEGGAS